MVQASLLSSRLPLTFCGGLGHLSHIRKEHSWLCNSRFSRPNPLRLAGTWHSRVLVACMSPPVHTSDSSRIPESSLESIVDDSDEIYLPPGTILVSLPVPLGVFTEQTKDGQVFVDEVEEGGNAAKPGGLEVGDIITAVSLPFGNCLLPVPKEGGVDMIADYISSRDPNEPLFHMAVTKGHDVDDLRSRAGVEETWMSTDEAERIAKEIHVNKYPRRPSGNEDAEQDYGVSAQELSEYGFDSESVKSILEDKRQR